MSIALGSKLGVQEPDLDLDIYRAKFIYLYKKRYFEVVDVHLLNFDGFKVKVRGSGTRSRSRSISI